MLLWIGFLEYFVIIMRDVIEVDRLWLVLICGIIVIGLLIETVYIIFLLVVDATDEFLPFFLFTSIALLQGGAIGYLMAFYILSCKFIKYNKLIIKSKQGFSFFERKPAEREEN